MSLNQSDDGDWYTPLMSELNRGIRLTSSTEARIAMEKLHRLLSKKDECAHSVTVETALPANIHIESLRKALYREPVRPDVVNFDDESRHVAVTTSFRCSREYAEKTALSNIEKAMETCLKNPDYVPPPVFYRIVKN